MDEELMRLSMTMHLIPNERAPPKTETKRRTTIRICEIVYGREGMHIALRVQGYVMTRARCEWMAAADALEIWSEHQRSLIRHSRDRYVDDNIACNWNALERFAHGLLHSARERWRWRQRPGMRLEDLGILAVPSSYYLVRTTLLDDARNWRRRRKEVWQR